jgi:hypothetical protein
MADTIITPASRDYDSGANAMGWAVAVILLLGVVLFGIFVWPGVGRVAPAAPANTDRAIDLNVTVPEAAIPGANNNGGAQGGTQQGGTQQGGTQTQ